MNTNNGIVAIPMSLANTNQNMTNANLVQMVPITNTNNALFTTPDNNYNIQSNFLPRILIILALYGVSIFAVVQNAKWWNSNPNFHNKKWIFSTTAIIVCLLFSLMLYVFLWYRCLITIRVKTDLYFIFTMLLFFIFFLTTFIDKDPDVSFFFGIFSLMSMVHLSNFVWTSCGFVYGSLSLIQIVFTFYLLAEVYTLHKCI